jgi:hypothetical protein
LHEAAAIRGEGAGMRPHSECCASGRRSSISQICTEDWRMNRRSLIALGLLSIPLAHAHGATLESLTSLKDPLLKAATSQLGLTEDQAKGGVGSYLTLLQEKLSKGDFDKIAGYIPGASGYIDSAKKLGAVTGPLNDLAGLNGALGKLGMSPETIAKFTPMVTNYIGKLGGENVQKMLAGVMGG